MIYESTSMEMKDSGISWIGHVPSNWSIAPFKSIASVQSGFPFDSEYFSTSEGFPLIRIRDITAGFTETYYNAPYSEEYIVKKEDFLIGMDGDFNVRWWESDDALLNQRCCKVVCKDDNLRKFLYYQMPITLTIINDLMYSTTVKHLSVGDINNMITYIPSNSNECEKIVKYLDSCCQSIDKQIVESNAMISKLEQLKQSIIFEAVTKGLDPTVEMKDSGVSWIKKIPRDWAIEPIKSHFSFYKGLPITKENLVESGSPVISYGQIHSKNNSGVSVSEELLRYVSPDYLCSNRGSLAEYGDILMADTSEDLEGCGNCIYIDYEDKIFAGYHTIGLRNKNVLKNNYFAYLFKTDAWRSQIRSAVYGVKVYSITKGILSDTRLIVPPYEVQNEITSFLDSECALIDSQIAEFNIIISKLKQLKQSTIYEYVTGKKQVLQEA